MRDSIVEYTRGRYKIVTLSASGGCVLYRRFMWVFWRRIDEFYSSYNAKMWIDDQDGDAV